MFKRIVAAWPIFAVAALLASCGVADTIGEELGMGDGRPGCVDATGPNSSSEELAEALLAATFTDPTTGERTSIEEQAGKFVDSAGEMMGSPLEIDTSPEGVRAKLVEMVAALVPEGGDARYAAAVCDWDAAAFERIGLFWEDEERVANTPHLLRASGRMVCASIDGQTAEDYFKELDEEARTAQSNPRKFLDEQIGKLETALAGMSDDPTDSDTARQIRADFERSLRMLREQDPQQVADGLQMSSDLQWLAVEHQCPKKSVLGFGEECGEVPSPIGHDPTKVKIHSGPVDCKEALDVIRAHVTGGSSATAPWKCEYNSNEETIDLLMMSCVHDYARIVAPRQSE